MTDENLKSTIRSIFNDDESGQKLVEFAGSEALRMGRELKSNQIRNIFTEVRKIEALWSRDPAAALRKLVMLKPKMTYQAIRNRPVERLREILTEAINEVQNASAEKRTEYFHHFLDLFEAILAYHRQYSGEIF